MIDLSTGEWKEALRLVQAARAAAFDFLRTARSKRLIGLAHLLQPGATLRSMQAALVPLERVDKRAKVTDSEMGIRTADAPAGRADRAAFTVVADNVRSAFNSGGIFRTADFFGADRLILCGYTPGPESAQVKKTALGADETTPWERAGDVRDAIDRLRAEGRRIYALETADGATAGTRPSRRGGDGGRGGGDSVARHEEFLERRQRVRGGRRFLPQVPLAGFARQRQEKALLSDAE